MLSWKKIKKNKLKGSDGAASVSVCLAPSKTALRSEFISHTTRKIMKS